MLASYLPARRTAPPSGRTGPLAWWARDYDGDEWVGHSHERRKGGLVAHSKGWIRAAARARGLAVRALRGGVINHQRWLEVKVL